MPDGFDMKPILAKKAEIIDPGRLRTKPDSYKSDLIREFKKECLDEFSKGNLKVIIQKDSFSPTLGPRGCS